MGIQIEDIIPWADGEGDTGLTARQKIARNFAAIVAAMQSTTSGALLTKDIKVTSPKTGNINTGDSLKSGMSLEDVFRKMLYSPSPATLAAALSTANDVEFGTAKGSITYTATQNESGAMTGAYYDGNTENVLKFGDAVNGVQQAVRRLEGIYTEGESYTATVTYGESADKAIPATVLTSKISVNVRRRWFAGIVSVTPTTSAEVRALAASGLYYGASTYKFSAAAWQKLVICIPEGTITDIGVTAYPGNFIQDTGVCSGPTSIQVEGADGSQAISYNMYIIAAKTTNDPDTFTFKTN